MNDSEELSLFDIAEERRDEGMALVEANAGAEWNAYAFEFCLDYLRTHAELFCDDLWVAGLERPHNAKALGPVMNRLARCGVMRKIGYRASATSNCSAKPVWESLIFEGEAP